MTKNAQRVFFQSFEHYLKKAPVRSRTSHRWVIMFNKPDSVAHEAVVIYLGYASPQSSIGLPPGNGRAILHCRYIWPFNSWGLPRIAVTCSTRELLPHVFTLITQVAHCDGYFLWHFPLVLPIHLPVRKHDALCCPDFPPKMVHIFSDNKNILQRYS